MTFSLLTDISDDLNGLLLTLASSLACVLGSLVICSDVVWRWLFPRSKFTLSDNHTFLTCSLALSSGVLIYTSLYKLMPEALAYYHNTTLVGKSAGNAQALLISTYLLGTALCAVINTIIHHFTSQSIVQCAHEGDHSHSNEESHAHALTHSHTHAHDSGSIHTHEIEPLIVESSDNPASIIRPISSMWSIRSSRQTDIEAGHLDESHVIHGTPLQDTSNFKVDATSPLLKRNEETEHYDSVSSNSNYSVEQQNTPTSTASTQTDLFSIGLQTAIAISVHKVPEGFLTFATSRADRELGFSVFLALAIHNISEGFTIAFPLFIALGSRSVAVLMAFVLSGLSQPFGAFLAWGMFKSGLIPNDGSSMLDSRSQLTFGIIVSVTAGFLSIIGFQMYGTASSLSGSRQNQTLACVFIGICIAGLGGCLTAKN